MQQALENIYRDPDKIIKHHVRLEVEAYGVSFRQLACKIRDHYNKLQSKFIYLDEGNEPAAVKSVSGKLAPYFGMVSDKNCRIPLQLMPSVVAALTDENRRHCAAAIRKLITFDEVSTDAASSMTERDLATGMTKELHEAIQGFTSLAFDGLANDSVRDLEKLDSELLEAMEAIKAVRSRVLNEVSSRQHKAGV